MFVIIGIAIVIGAILGGYLMEHGNIRVLLLKGCSPRKNRQHVEVCHRYHNGKDRLPGFAVFLGRFRVGEIIPDLGNTFSLHPTIHIDGRGLYFSLKAD